MSAASFTAQLAASAERAFPKQPPTDDQLERYLRSLHLEDLALACACAEGVDSAWDHFVLTYRPVLYRAAGAIGASDRAREVADSLYAELFGLNVRDGERRSHFRYFHGRSSLATWLRAVLSQRYVDVLRQTARLDPLPDDESAQAFSAAPSRGPAHSARYLRLLQRVIAAVIAALAARDRLRLRCYYAQNLTLAEIGRVVGEHEATVSRNLARTRREIRRQTETVLRERERMTDAEIDECFAMCVEDPGTLDLVELLGEETSATDGRKEVVHDRSK